jgi:hypothetical protein
MDATTGIASYAKAIPCASGTYNLSVNETGAGVYDCETRWQRQVAVMSVEGMTSFFFKRKKIESNMSPAHADLRSLWIRNVRVTAGPARASTSKAVPNEILGLLAFLSQMEKLVLATLTRQKTANSGHLGARPTGSTRPLFAADLVGFEDVTY